MRFAIISDIHLGREELLKGFGIELKKPILPLLKEFIENINQDSEVKFIVQLGDLITADNLNQDKKNLSLILDLLNKSNVPVYHVSGNHDFWHLEQELKGITSYDELHYSFDMEDFHCVALFSEPVRKIGGGVSHIRINQEQVGWLKKDLKKTNKKTIVFVHHSLAEENLKYHFWFENRPNVCLIQNREEVRNIIEDSGKVVAVFMGHLHWNRPNNHNSIPYFTLQSMVQDIDRKGFPSNSYTIIDIDKKSINVNIKGNVPKKFGYSYDSNKWCALDN